jgi:hypothetical protein
MPCLAIAQLSSLIERVAASDLVLAGQRTSLPSSGSEPQVAPKKADCDHLDRVDWCAIPFAGRLDMHPAWSRWTTWPQSRPARTVPPERVVTSSQYSATVIFGAAHALRYRGGIERGRSADLLPPGCLERNTKD